LLRALQHIYARKDEALRSSYMMHTEAVVIAEAIARVPDLVDCYE
jgi:hypothetical protein